MKNYKEQVKSDCEQILSRFQETKSVRFQDFTTIWREMNFSQIYYGTPQREGRAFVRLILDTAYAYFLPPFSFQIRVGGLYLLYSLYQCQTNARRKQIRVALKDWDEVKKFERDAMNTQHVDAVYILRRLMFLKAFHFTAMPTVLTYHRQRKEAKSTFCENFVDRSSHLQELVNTDLMEELSNVHSMYKKLKSSVSLSSQQTSSLDLVHRDVVPQLIGSVIDFYKWQQEKDTRTAAAKDDDSGEGTSSRQESSRRAQLLASIKSKAYGEAAEASKSRRHRQVEVNLSSNEAGPSFKPLYTRVHKPTLKARTDDIHISSDTWKDSMTTTSIYRLTRLDFDPAGIKRLPESFKKN